MEYVNLNFKLSFAFCIWLIIIRQQNTKNGNIINKLLYYASLVASVQSFTKINTFFASFTETMHEKGIDHVVIRNRRVAITWYIMHKQIELCIKHSPPLGKHLSNLLPIADFRVTAGTQFYFWIYTFQSRDLDNFWAFDSSGRGANDQLRNQLSKNNLSLIYSFYGESDNNKFNVIWLRY